MAKPAPLPHDDRRQNPRYRLVTPGTLTLPARGGVIKFRTTDLSLGGVGIMHDTPIVAGTKAYLRMALMLPERKPQPFEALVRAKYSTFGDMWLRTGLQFLVVNPAHQQLLKLLLTTRPQMFESEEEIRL